MEETRKRRTFDKEFKISAAKLVVEKGQTSRQVSQDLGISQNTLLHWKKNYIAEKENSFPGKGHQKPEDALITELRKDNAMLREQRDILKKALAFFTQNER